MTGRDKLVERIAQAIVDKDAEPWPARAACAKTPELVDHTRAPKVWEGLRLCAGCPVIAECLNWAENEPDYVGIAGGAVWTTKHRRRRSSTYAIDLDAS